MRNMIPVSTAAAPGALAAQRNVSRAIYSQVPSSNVMVLVNNYNQIVLRGSAPTPSLRHRLLQLASAAAGGYSIVDQLASEAVSSAAGAATSAAIGGVSDLIHGSGSNSGPDTSGGPPYYGDQGPPYGSAYPPNGNSGTYGNSAPDSGGPPYNGDQGPPYGPPGSDTGSGSYGSNTSLSGLTPGTRGCVNVYNDDQVFLTGETTSQVDADRLRQFAHQVGGANANVTDQLGTRSNGASSTPPPGNTPGPTGASTSTSSTAAPLSQSAIVTPGSVVCIDADNYSQVLLTGTVGSPSEFARVEEAVQPFLGDYRLIDELTTGTIDVGSRVSGTGGTSGTATSAGAAEAVSAPTSGGAIASSSQPAGAGASGVTLPVSQSEIQQALHSIPSLSNVDAEVTANSVRLSGSVDTAGDKQTARDIARQYAPNRDVIDDLTINQRARDVNR